MSATLTELIKLKEIQHHVYETLGNPERMGNAANIAYGGCTLAVGVSAACHSVRKTFRLYSALGTFLGPAFVDRKLQCNVRVVRDTRTFSTRVVEVSQVQGSGLNRTCMIILADFQSPEKATLLTYSSPPTATPKDWRVLSTSHDYNERLLTEGKITTKLLKQHDADFSMSQRFLDVRPNLNSVGSQNLKGMAKDVQTTQDHLPLYEKTTSDWFRIKHSLQTYNEQLSALAFVADAAVAFVALMHNHMFWDSTSACASLDFALRVFSNDIDLNQFHLREFKTVTGGDGRTYSEARFWDDRQKMIASMTQQSILRPRTQKI